MNALVHRRRFLAAMPALLAAPRAFTQPPAPRIAIRGLNHVTIVVPDLKPAVEFYQGLFGFAKERRARTFDAGLRIAPGVGMDLTTDRPDLTPRIDHFCFGVERFDVDRVVSTLAAHGIEKSDARGPMKVQLSTRDGATLVYVGDPDGIPVQLQDPGYCGGTGMLGNECETPEPSAKKGILSTRGYTGVSITSPNPTRSIRFYQRLFGPVAAVNVSSGPARIDHFSFKIDGYDRDRIARALERYGVHPRAGTAPMDRDSLYFTDVNGILVQIA